MRQITEEQAVRLETIDKIIAQCETAISSGTWDHWHQEDLSRAKAERLEILYGSYPVS